MSNSSVSAGAKTRRVAWAGIRLAFGIVALTVLLVLFAGVFAGSVFVAGRIIASGNTGEESVLAQRRAEREANEIFDQMVTAADPVTFAGEQTAAVDGGYLVERAYEIPILARFEIESRFGTVSGVTATWEDAAGTMLGFGENRREIREGYQGVVLSTTISD